MGNDSDQRRREVQAQYDALAENGIYATLAPHDRGGRKSRYVAAVFDAALLPRLRSRGQFRRLLDFGCGTGIFTTQVFDLGADVVGVDVSMAMLRSAARLMHGREQAARLVMMDGLHLPFGEETFDRIVARESLCYVPDDRFRRLMNEIGRIAIPGAVMFILDQVSENARWQHHPMARNLKKRSIDEILQVVQSAGFVLEESVVVRQPRFPWIYAIWLGIVPMFVMPYLAKAEVVWNRLACPLRTRRWHNALFVFRRQ